MSKLDPKVVRDQITNLLLCYPDLEADDVLRTDMIEGETEAFEFLSRVVQAINNAQVKKTGLSHYIDALKERYDRFARRTDVLRVFAKQVMDTANIKKAELPEATLSIRNGVPKVIITNEHEIPDGYMRIKKEPDKTKIKAAIAGGDHVPGAALSNSETTLAILIR
jgi:hypothetical protein